MIDYKRDDNPASQPLAEKTPACRFNLGDKVKIPYISDCNKHNNKVGEITEIRRYKYYPDRDINNPTWRYEITITYPDGQKEAANPNRKSSGLVSEVVLVEPCSARNSLDAQIQSASTRATKLQARPHTKVNEPEPEI